MSWDKLKHDCENCHKCELSLTRKSVVFGDGNINAEVVLIGEGPGAQEDSTGLPFVGSAGMLLNDMLKMINLDRTKVYICNVVKCRPPQNRDPSNSERDACKLWLSEQLKLIKPKIIVCLGRVAATTIIDSNFHITQDHGKWYKKNNIYYTAIYHPAALLRDENKRPETFIDLKSIQQQIRNTCIYTY